VSVHMGFVSFVSGSVLLRCCIDVAAALCGADPF